MASSIVEASTRRHVARALGMAPAEVGAMRVLIVAEGGGHGHALRAHALGALFGAADIIARGGAAAFLPPSANIRWHRTERPEDAVRVVSARGPGVDLIIVDTFSRGLFGTMHRALCPGTPWALIRRHVRPEHDVAPAPGHYESIWLPYGRGTCEWDGLEPGAYIGHPMHPMQYVGSRAVGLAVIGDAALLPVEVQAALPVDSCLCPPPYHAIPRAWRYVAVGAGYHGVYRHLAAGHAVRFWPQPRRFDDQYWRAERVGRLLSPTNAAAWIAAQPLRGENGENGRKHV